MRFTSEHKENVLVDRTRSVLITGSNGMVGRAVCAEMQSRGWTQLLTPERSELELADTGSVNRYFEQARPTYVVHLAAKVGGIAANMKDPVGFLTENTSSNLNVLTACQRYAIEKLLFLGSSCVYPRNCPQPMREEYLLTGPLEPTNEGYALSKIVGLRLAAYLHEQYGVRVVCPMPCNLYGTNDHFDFERSHVLSALVRRFVEAVDDGAPSLTLWGTGKARREFMHVSDAARAIVELFERFEDPRVINVGVGDDVSIRELAEMIANETGYQGRLEWDPTRPDGMPRKCLDVSRLSALGFTARVSLREGIAQTIGEFRVRRAGAVFS